jgi:hypothetical protein
MQKWNPESRYKYFPTHDPKTWEGDSDSLMNMQGQSAMWSEGEVWWGGWSQGGMNG